MKRIIKTAILCFICTAAFLLLSSCAQMGQYEQYDEQGYTFSVKYDANGGAFSTGVDVMVDTYRPADLPTNPTTGNKEALLLAPDDTRRGSNNYFTASNPGYFLAGWYTERTPVRNEQGETLDQNGNVTTNEEKIAYTYSGRWDFENGRMEIDPNKTYTAGDAVTLYAAWIPEFKYEFYAVGSGELLGEHLFDPNYVSSISFPYWNEEDGTLKMGNFPTLTDKTLNVDGIYADMEGKIPLTGDALVHTGKYDPSNATAQDSVMKIYLDYKDGEWYRIYTAKQFLDNASVNGHYEICADLDFSGLTWKNSLLYNQFNGQILGNGHTFRNITTAQANADKAAAGLFGVLGSEAVIDNVKFEAITFTVQIGTRLPDVSYGLFAGQIKDGAKISGVSVTDAKLLIDAGASNLQNCSIGLVCGSGWSESLGIDLAGITCEVTGKDPSSITVTTAGNEVEITFTP